MEGLSDELTDKVKADMEELVRNAVGSGCRPAGPQDGLADLVAPDPERVQGINRPVPVVAEHSIRGFVGRPPDRPDLLPALPQQLKSFTAVGGKCAVRPLDGSDTVFGLDPCSAEPYGSAGRVPTRQPPEFGFPDRPGLGLLGQPEGATLCGLFQGEAIGGEAPGGQPTASGLREVGPFARLAGSGEVEPHLVIAAAAVALPLLPPG
eukprot:3194169-Alexandrium_andersonii.AAC.2